MGAVVLDLHPQARGRPPPVGLGQGAVEVVRGLVGPQAGAALDQCGLPHAVARGGHLEVPGGALGTHFDQQAVGAAQQAADAVAQAGERGVRLPGVPPLAEAQGRGDEVGPARDAREDVIARLEAEGAALAAVREGVALHVGDREGGLGAQGVHEPALEGRVARELEVVAEPAAGRLVVLREAPALRHGLEGDRERRVDRLAPLVHGEGGAREVRDERAPAGEGAGSRARTRGCRARPAGPSRTSPGSGRAARWSGSTTSRPGPPPASRPPPRRPGRRGRPRGPRERGGAGDNAWPRRARRTPRTCPARPGAPRPSSRRRCSRRGRSGRTRPR